MKQMIRTTAALCLALLFLPTAVGAAQVTGKHSGRIDRAKTIGLYQGWSTRKSFPESVSLAYFPVYAMRALGKKLPPKARARIVTFLKSCQEPDGGFANEPRYAQKSNIIYTFYALKALQLLGQPQAINRQQALAFLLALHQPGGGFKAAGTAKHPSLAATSYGVRSLALLNELDRIDKGKTAAFIAAYKVKGKGFSLLPGKFSTPRATFMAVQALKTLGVLPAGDKSDVKAYLKTTRYAGHMVNRKYYGLPTMQDMSYVLRTLRDLSVLKVADRPRVSKFVDSLYIAQNGGFGPQPGYGTTPPSTYYGIVCLVQLGRLPNPME